MNLKSIPTSPIDFHDSTLLITPRSPFARRIRIALLENQIRFTEQIYDVFNPSPELIEANPLARVPTLILKSGQILIDSNLILQCLYENIESPWIPRPPTMRAEMYHWQALAEGMCEKIVEYYIDSLRPEQHRDPEVYQELREISERVLSAIEKRLIENKRENAVSCLVGPELTQADFDMGAALAYMLLRNPKKWQEKFPHTFSYFQRLDERPSFQKTKPPAV